MNQLKTFLLMAALGALLVAIGGYMGGKYGATLALIIAFVMNIGSYWFSDKVVLKMYNAAGSHRIRGPGSLSSG